MAGWFYLWGGPNEALSLFGFPLHVIFGANAIHP
jgi:hypothetical protein